MSGRLGDSRSRLGEEGRRTISDQQVREVLDGYAAKVRDLTDSRDVLLAAVEACGEWAKKGVGLPDDDTIGVPLWLLRRAMAVAREERRHHG